MKKDGYLVYETQTKQPQRLNIALKITMDIKQINLDSVFPGGHDIDTPPTTAPTRF